MKRFIIFFSITVLSACSTVNSVTSDWFKSSPKQQDTSTGYSPQKIMQAVQSKYPDQRTHLIYIGAPDGFIAPRETNSEVSSGVDSGKVVDIITAMTVKTSTLVITGNDETITATTLSRALTVGKEKVSGAKVIYVGGKESLPNLSKLATDAGVTIEFMDLPS